MQEKINKWLDANYDEIVLIAKKVTKNKEYREIAHWTIMQFIDNKKALTLIDNGEALKYISGIIHISYHTSTSTWARQNPTHQHFNNDIDVINNDEYNYQLDNMLEQLDTLLNMKHNDIIIWFNLTLLKMWMHNPNYVSLSKQLDIPRTTISRAVNEGKKWIKNNIDYDNNNFN